ncbi:MFS general substrate transporter [Neocallimastix lanati (nom. inval.)]|nr:MFS general substrate transporter [Neocallimastix sp. JGI-2020a]
MDLDITEKVQKYETKIEEKKPPSVVDLDFIKYRFSTGKFILIYISIVLSLVMANLDTTIISTALSKINSEFHAYDSFTWVITVYMLTNTAIQPLCGKFADIFGCRTLMIFILIIFTAASFLCGIAPNIGVLIVGRALQGIGSGGIAALAFIIIADITSLRKRGIYMGVNGAIYAVTSVIGPLLGGFFTDQLTWRWSFFINLPIGIICIIFFVLYFKIPTEKSSFIEKFKRIDFLGTFTLIACLVVALLGLNWGGAKYSWKSPTIITLFIVSFALLIFYIIIEFKFAKEPITPPVLFKYRNITASSVTNFLEGIIFLNVINTLPLLYQDGRLFSATYSGLRLVPISVFLTISSMGTGYLIGKWGHIDIYIKLGCFFSIIAVYLISLIGIDTQYYIEFLIFIIYGLSCGVIYQNCIMVAQRASPPEYLSISTTITSFFNYIGGAIGVTVYGAILQNIFPKYYRDHNPNYRSVTVNDVHDIPDGNRIYVDAIQTTYLYSIFPVTILLFISSLFIQNIKESKSNKKDTKNNQENITVNISIPKDD